MCGTAETFPYHTPSALGCLQDIMAFNEHLPASFERQTASDTSEQSLQNF